MTKRSRRHVRMLHTSDCHIGASTNLLEEAAFASAIALARDEAVDIVLIAGDLFDHARVDDASLAWTATQLSLLACPVVVIPGNHDSHAANSVYDRFRPALHSDVTFLDRVDGQVVDLPELDLAIWGKAMVEHSPTFRPLDGVPPRPAAGWAVVAAHGLVLDTDVPTHRASPIYPHDIDAVRWDYIALGHIHQHRVVRMAPVPAVYCGATATSNHGEPGVVVVSLSPDHGVTFDWRSLQRLTPSSLADTSAGPG